MADDDKSQRRLEQNRLAAQRSRAKKKEYIKYLETSCSKLVHIAESSTNAHSGTAAFEMAYHIWAHNKKLMDVKLQALLEHQSSEAQLREAVTAVLGHCCHLFQMKANTAKADVLYFMHGLWRTPIERLYQWLGGPRPSKLLQILMAKVGPLTNEQQVGARTLEHSCQLLEDALDVGIERFKRTLDTVDITKDVQRTLAMEAIEELEGFLILADDQRLYVLKQMTAILPLHQAAKGLLALAEHTEHLLALNASVSAHNSKVTSSRGIM